jgi:DUF4097 and DUF4098 domain-containing protein YvlB
MRASLLSTAIVAASLALAVEAAHADTFRQQVAADPRGEVDVSNIAGSIVISGWDQPTVSVSADLPSDTERVKVTSAHGHTSVCVTYEHGCSSSGSKSFFGGKTAVRLEVHVPRGSELDVSGVSADITTDGLTGRQHLHTVSGDIRAALGSGDDDVNSVSGDIDLHGSGQDGTLHVASVSGDLTVTDAAGELEARTVNGRLTAGLSSARRVRLNTTSGAIGLNARLKSGGTVEAETVSGDGKFDVSASAGYAYEAKSFSGDIEDCFGQQPNKSQYGPGSRLSGTRGGGAGHVRIKSLSGDISLCDR